MAFPLMLLPVLLGADPVVIATGELPHVEQALSDGIRAQALGGWTVADVRTVNDELVVTLSKSEAFEQHVIHFDKRHTYRVERDIKPPTDLEEPSPFFAAALASPAGGGVEISSGCGDYSLLPYVVDEHATGEFATALVARTLSTADRLSEMTDEPDRVKFTITKREVTRELFVWLDRKGAVIEAQVRRPEYGGGGGTYTQLPALKKALSKTRVIGVQGDTLITPKGKFVIDPDGSFDYDDVGEGGCGC